jgi:ssDNA-binding Zn-finger/Zn-ribbon topoisomerase 1
VWPALVSEVEAAAARRIVGARAGKAQKTPRPGRLRYLATAVTTCDVCGTAMRSTLGPKGRQPSYVCGSPQRCTAINMAGLDDYLNTLMVARLTQPDVLTRLTAPDDDAVIKARGEAMVLRQRLKEHVEEAKTGNLSAKLLGEIERGLTPKILAAEERAETISAPLVLVEMVKGTTTIKKTERRRELIRQRWDTAPLATRKEIIRALCAHVKIISAGGRRGPAGTIDTHRIKVTWRRYPTTAPAGKTEAA